MRLCLEMCLKYSYSQVAYIIDRISEVRVAVRKGAVNSVFDAESSGISFVDTRSRFVISQMVSTFSVSSGAMQKSTIIAIRTNSCKTANRSRE